MFRNLSALVGIGLLVAWAGEADAQVKVVRKPAPAARPDEYVVYDHWVSSWGLRDDPADQYPMGIKTHRTLAAALSSAQAHINNTRGNGEWAVTHYLIEGEASLRSKGSPTLPDAERLESDTLAAIRGSDEAAKHASENPVDSADPKEKLFYDTFKSLNKTLTKDARDALRGRVSGVSAAYRRASEAKSLLTKNVGAIADDNFRKTNALIAEYNALADQYSRDDPGREYFARLPRMTPVGDSFGKDVANWNQALERRQRLEEKKRRLEEERAKLETTREQLVQEAQEAFRESPSTDPIDVGATSLVDSEWEIPASGNIFGLRILRFTSEQDVVGHYNVEATKRAGTWRQLEGNQVEIDIGGKTIATLRGSQLSVGRVTLNQRKPGRPDPLARAKAERARQERLAAEAGAAKRQQAWQTRSESYQQASARYDAELADYEAENKAHSAEVSRLEAQAYVAPVVVRPETPARVQEEVNPRRRRGRR